MAKRKPVASKPAVDSFAALVTNCEQQLIAISKDWAHNASAAKGVRGELSERTLVAMLSLRAGATDYASYHTAGLRLYGNGLKHTQKGYEPGSLKAALIADETCKGENTAKTRISNMRIVFAALWDDAVYAKARETGTSFTAIYDAVKTKKTSATSAPKPTGAADIDLAHMTVDQALKVVERTGTTIWLAAAAIILKRNTASDLDGRTVEAIALRASVK